MSDIIKTQQGLARKAETNKAHHFEDVYHLLCKREWIEEALQHVLDNDGSGTAGVDGMSWKSFNDVDKSDFENEKFRQQFIETLQKELKGHTFKPMPVRRVEIPKPGTNKKRPLGIPTLKDRTVQTLLKMLMPTRRSCRATPPPMKKSRIGEDAPTPEIARILCL